MPAFTFTADNTTEVLTTSSAHGLTTGDGPVDVRNVGGALPTGLVGLTDYWAIVTGASTLKLATSSANALLGTAINITTNGTGTNYLEIGVPYRRPRTYAAGSQLKSADLNANFDAWRALWALTTGQSESVWGGAVTLAGLLSANAGVTCAANQHVTVSGTGRFKHGDMIMNVSPITGDGSGWAWDNTNGYLLSSGAGSWVVGIPTIVGWTIKSFTYELYGDGAADLSGSFNRRPKASTPDTPVAIGATNPAASWSDQVTDISPDKTIADGDSVWIVFTASAANLRIGDIRVTYAMVG